jgi:hypothetical protein
MRWRNIQPSYFIQQHPELYVLKVPIHSLLQYGKTGCGVYNISIFA